MLIDGRAVEGKTPMGPIEVAAGRHEVSLCHPEWDDAVVTVHVEPEKTVEAVLAPTRPTGVPIIESDAAAALLQVDGGPETRTGFPARLVLTAGDHRVVARTEDGTARAETGALVRKDRETLIRLPLARREAPPASEARRVPPHRAGAYRSNEHAKAKALRKRRIHGPSSPQKRSGGRHESCTERKPRSGWGIMMVARPSADVKAVRPPSEPFGLWG